eukprot:3250843-Pleurochrysis_carterae.AAC.1
MCIRDRLQAVSQQAPNSKKYIKRGNSSSKSGRQGRSGRKLRNLAASRNAARRGPAAPAANTI